MTRPLVIGNGNLLINFDRHLVLRDLYYPMVGQVNHVVGRRNLVGIWTENRFSWSDEDSWHWCSGYRPDSLVTEACGCHRSLGLDLVINDGVHYRYDVFVRGVRVTNRADRRREVRLFFTNDVDIDESDVGDTALYDPGTDAIIHYKRSVAFLFSGMVCGTGIHQYSCGRKRFAGAEGTWRDAEDGWLEGNPVSHGAVDSTFSLSIDLDAGEQATYYYWIAAGKGVGEVRRLHDVVHRHGPQLMLDETETYWRSWVTNNKRPTGDLNDDVTGLFRRSLLIIRTQTDNRGGITAANDSDILMTNRDHYSYVWPRDGALIAWALDLAGYAGVTRPFFQFSADALAPDGYLWQKYNPDGTLGSTWHPWLPVNAGTGLLDPGPPPLYDTLPIQEDETALVLCALYNTYDCHRDLEFIVQLFTTLIKPAATFLVEYRDPRTRLPLPSFDLWEERWGVHTFTVATVYGGLRAAARLAGMLGEEELATTFSDAAGEIRTATFKYLYSDELGRFIRGYTADGCGVLRADPVLESSLAGLWMFGMVTPDDERMVRTMTAIRRGLWVNTGIGGIARYAGDYYFRRSDDLARVPGNPWLICTLWLAQWHIRVAADREDLAVARTLLEWAAERALETGVLPEQLHPETGEPLSVTPLTWAHATFVSTVVEYGARWQQLGGGKAELDQQDEPAR